MIPNIVHFVYGLEEQEYDFLFVYYLSVLSAKLINNPDKIYFHYTHKPTGKWWDETEKLVELNQVECPATLGGKSIVNLAHKADRVRLEVLEDCGGVYFDMDTVCVSPYKHLLDYSCVMGTEEKKLIRGVHHDPRLCNAVIFAEPNSEFIKKWIDSADTLFDPDNWLSYAVEGPSILYQDNKDLVHVEQPSSFFSPSWDDIPSIFLRDKPIPKELITLHLWEAQQRFDRKGLEGFKSPNKNKSSIISQISDFSWSMAWPETLYGRIMKKIENLNMNEKTPNKRI